MGIRQFIRRRSILSILLLTITFAVSWYTVNPSTSTLVADTNNNNHNSKNKKMADSADDVISKLKVSVRQVSGEPAKLAISVTNAHSGAVTILSWNSPLDPLALQLGVVSFAVPAGSEDDSSSPIQIPTIQIRRRMPPGPESLVTIGAGQTSEQEVEVKGPLLETLRGRRVAARCSGEWTSVWLSEADAITKVSLDNAGASEDALRGSFQSEVVEIVL
ncbi:uncharacterized protein GGS22DRAFT_162765 [Annulohypoxylon maeteangense]|uniref:uncharacterized protein n=1 Tax=Annulohypoxylon maeteangense TaxID=1927788 RepID=UPI0020075777|nr:uncharacterized protein GGS22DRAFT_162765 [Annulohypoxylon maeteangense]KAI0885097.1 hypothetical protein GGS22DRAFT_162765 [Annulohypoxylon maeteangense]